MFLNSLAPREMMTSVVDRLGHSLGFMVSYTILRSSNEHVFVFYVFFSDLCDYGKYHLRELFLVELFKKSLACQ